MLAEKFYLVDSVSEPDKSRDIPTAILDVKE